MDPFANFTMWMRVGAAALIIMVVGAIGLTVRHWHQQSLRVDAAEARVAQVEQQARQVAAQYQKQQEAAQNASQHYQDEIASLSRTRRVIRVCRDANLPADPPAAQRADAGTSTSGVVSDGVGPPVGGNLEVTDLLLAADKCSAQLRSLQAWVRSTRE